MLIGLTTPPATLDELVPPDVRDRLDRLDLLSRRILSGKLPGERRSKRRGQSVEFDDYRAYIPGDDLRHVDWNVYARFDRFVLKLFREEEDLAVHLVVDASASMLAGAVEAGERGGGRVALTKLVFAHRLAMAIAYLALVAQNRVHLSVLGSGLEGASSAGVRTLGAIRGRAGVRRAAEFLLASLAQPIEARVRGRGRLTDALRAVALRRESRGVMVLLSDFLEPGGVGMGLNYLAGGGRFDAHCVQILSPGELDPATQARAGLVGDLRLMDVETGGSLEVTLTAAALAGYRRRLATYLERLERDCLSRSMSYLRATTDQDPIALLLGPMRARGVVG